jgi:hypothetical protein
VGPAVLNFLFPAFGSSSTLKMELGIPVLQKINSSFGSNSEKLDPVLGNCD